MNGNITNAVQQVALICNKGTKKEQGKYEPDRDLYTRQDY